MNNVMKCGESFIDGEKDIIWLDSLIYEMMKGNQLMTFLGYYINVIYILKLNS